MDRFLIVGAGLSGAVLARELAEAGHSCLVIDRREHVAGNCHTERDPGTGIMVHRYGPHIFNTDNEAVWRYVNRFADFRPFTNRVKASTERGIFGLPINLHTINQFFGTRLNPAEARAFLAERADRTITDPQNFEEQALSMIGPELYEAFFRGYTIKQWGVDPKELPASILKRLPVRFNYDDAYYAKRYQAIPAEGYTTLTERILAHGLIEVKLGTVFEPMMTAEFTHTFYTGPLDAFFGFAEGRLGYRTVYWERTEAEGDFQGNAVINYPGLEAPHTRIHEHKHFAPWETHAHTLAFTEFSKETEPGETPYYPKRLAADKAILTRYASRVQETEGVSFLGRLATYRYLDMEKVIAEALTFAAEGLAGRNAQTAWPRVSAPLI
ncbi:MAG: UDP-galactopyranose mutase [Opitutales bacterium]